MPFVGTGEANFLGGVARKYGAPFDVDVAKKRFFERYLEAASQPATNIGYAGTCVCLSMFRWCIAHFTRLEQQAVKPSQDARTIVEYRTLLRQMEEVCKNVILLVCALLDGQWTRCHDLDQLALATQELGILY